MIKEKKSCVSVLLLLKFDQDPSECILKALSQDACLEVLVSDYKASSFVLKRVKEMAHRSEKLRIVDCSQAGSEADSLNIVLDLARGTYISFLLGNEVLMDGSLNRAINLFNEKPHLLMAYSDFDLYSLATRMSRQIVSMPESVGVRGLIEGDFVCHASVLLKRSLVYLVGKFDGSLDESYFFDLWLRVFLSLPHRIAWLPYVQVQINYSSDSEMIAGIIHNDLNEYKLLVDRYAFLGRSSIRSLVQKFMSSLDSVTINDLGSGFLMDFVDTAKQYLDSDDYVLLSSFLSDFFGQALIAGSHKKDHLNAFLEIWNGLGFRLLRSLHPFLGIEGEIVGVSEAVLQKNIDKLIRLSRSYPSFSIFDGISSIAKCKGLSKGFCDRPFGVNLVGHAFDVFGIGEDIRMAAKALESVGIPFSVINYPARNGSRRDDFSLEGFLHDQSGGGPYAFNLICMAAPIQARWMLEAGISALQGRFTIAAWPWETKIWPSEWEVLLDFVDAIWASSSFTASSLEGLSASKGIPLKVMPMAAEIKSSQNYSSHNERLVSRCEYNIPSDKFVFCYGFDFNSTSSRKNPMGAVEAFQRAFPKEDDSKAVGLVVKTFAPKSFNRSWEWLLRRQEEDPRIQIFSKSLSKEDLYRLYGCCDVFLSLHRSEGFGRGLAEALQLGLQVVATNYGGNTDFCLGDSAHAVGFEEVPVPRGAYPFADGHLWASPNLEDAVDVCRYLYENRKKIHRETSASCWDVFSFSRVGSLYKDELKKIYYGSA